jgi:signal recognition particle subunit SRP19
MRQQDKAIIWPAYFDATKTRKDGRRVAKNLAVLSPKASEIKEAVQKLHFEYELVPDTGYAKMPWLRPGMVLVKKGKESKEQMIQKIARQLQKIRNTSPVKP